MLLQLSDHPGLVLREHPGMDVINAGLVGDPLCGAFIVASHEDGLETALAERGDRLGRVRAQRVTERKQPEGAAVAGHRDDCPPGGLELLDPLLQPRESDATTGQKTRAADYYVVAADACGDAF